MNASTKHTILALAVTALLGSCSRPVATFQPSKAERFYSAQATVAPVVSPEIAASEPVAAVTPVAVAEAVPANVTVEQALAKAEVYASTNARPADARKLERRITKIREVLAQSPQQTEATAGMVAGTAKKSTMVQRMMLKSMDKKIQKHLAPEQPMRSQTLTAGLVVGLIGLLLLLLTSGVAATIGLVALVAGIVLVILGLI